MPEHNLSTIAFPTLTEKQIAELARYADATKKFAVGEKLFHLGERGRKFFVIKSGEVEITDETGETSEDDHDSPAG